MGSLREAQIADRSSFVESPPALKGPPAMVDTIHSQRRGIVQVAQVRQVGATSSLHSTTPVGQPRQSSMSSIKRDVKKKAPPRPEDRGSFSRSSPLCFVTSEEVRLVVHSRKLSRLRVAMVECERRGKQDDVNHGSIRGSWPIAISGYPRGHSVSWVTRCRSTRGRSH